MERKKIDKGIGSILVLSMVAALSGCSLAQDASSTVKSKDPVSDTVFAMDTYMTITCYGEHAADGVEASIQEIKRLDDMLSVGNAQSEISQLNSNGKASVSQETADMFDCALELFDSTEGAFDITIFPLMQLWGFTDKDLTSETFKVPEDQKIKETLAYTGAEKLQWDSEKREMVLGENQGVDLGGIAKGYTSSRLMDVMKDAGVESGIVSLAGNVQCLGSKEDGSAWTCAVTNPHEPESTSDFLCVLKITDKAIITSGGYERYFEDQETGEVYQHILDPKTGYPVQSDLISASIVSKDGMLADGLSTSCYVMGLDKSIAYWKQNSDKFDMILMTNQDEVYVTEGLQDCIESDFDLQFISSK